MIDWNSLTPNKKISIIKKQQHFDINQKMAAEGR